MFQPHYIYYHISFISQPLVFISYLLFTQKMSSFGNESPPISPPGSPFIDFLDTALKELMDDDVEKAYMEVMEAHAAESSRSTTTKRRTIERNREDGDKRLWNDYFSGSVYPESYFRRRFRMSKQLFIRIVEGVSNHSPYFQQRYDCTGRKGLSPIQKCTAAIRQLANGTSADLCDEYVRIGETTAVECLQNFCRCVVEVFSEKYLRQPNASDIQHLTEAHSSKHGFPGMLGSIDCMHWAWKNCPVAWKGQYTRGDHGYPTIMLEAVASYDLWIWHAYFGVAGSNNDINVLNQSPVFNQVLQGNAPPCNFTVNGTPYTIGYYLADGIYPEWATLVKSFTYPQSDKMKEFKKRHESARKDVERAFGVLQARWAIVRSPARAWSLQQLSDIMYACIIMHNMIVEDEGYAICDWLGDDDEDGPIVYEHGAPTGFESYLQRFKSLRNQEAHHALRADLVEHIWSIRE